MSDGSDPGRLIVIEILKIAGSFVFGLLMRNEVGRFLITAKKRFLNDFITINLISIHTYKSIEIENFDLEVFQHMQKRIPNLKIVSISHKAMQIGMPTFGTMNIILTEEPNLDEEGALEEIKISLSLENPIRIGIREINLINDYYNITEQVHHVVEGMLSERPKLKRNYIIAEISRISGFLEEKTFEIDNEDLSAHIHATSSKITIVAEPPTYIVKAVKKYLLT
uniref:Uncharacterized protein n=1 Tax=viral metagenome TaxID=1070528 RepID=A0A6M3LX79_9ZZZZ